MARSPAPSPFQSLASHKATPYPEPAADSDNEDDENMLTATGDISLSYPCYVPGAVGALSPKPHSRRGTTNSRAGLAPVGRPRPPARRLTSSSAATYKFRTLTLKGGSGTSTPCKLSSDSSTPATRTPAVADTPNSSASPFSSIRTIPDEGSQTSTPQSRFAAFMASRNLAESPKKKAVGSVAERNQRVEALAQAAKAVIAPRAPASRPLRGYAALPARLPIPNWGAMDVDDM
ncbi:hypothetical protein B0H15DRAFT_797039 [Mycena belliarum]|uniref:Uncharacterized protein n=1 Tax=Mycena belliarum TaxID=1033014 RepID=A0AAD6UDB5_9AGAR|nr:hypothetical protein B0H15DRAFT_797039 [Mycena belliae]